MMNTFFNNKLLLTLSAALVLSTSISSESWAINCPTGTQGSDDSSASNYCGTNCCWGIDANNVLTITPAINTSTGKPYENVTMADFSYTTPGTNSANGYTRSDSSNAPWQRQGATSIVIEAGITNIGQRAFEGDTKITSVSGMENVTNIGSMAFGNAYSLQSVEMPNVTRIESNAFQEAYSLQSVDMPNVTTLAYCAFCNATSLKSINMPNVTSIGGWALQATALESVDIPNVTTIQDGAFMLVASLKDLTIPASASIGDYAFNRTSTLTDVNCLGTETQCNALKSRMEAKEAEFADGAFHIITTPTPNCGGYSQGVCSTCANGYHSADNSCVANPANCKVFADNACSECASGYHLADNSCVANPANCKVFAGNSCSECLSGYLTKENGCVEPSSCTGEYLISGNECIKMPGCVNFANGACGGCESGYYKKENGCVVATEGCGDGYLEKNSVCISAAQGCGEGYKDMGGFCNRVRYTPAEAAAILNDDDNTITITFKK